MCALVVAQRRHDRVEALLVEAHRPLDRSFGGVGCGFVAVGVVGVVVDRHQARQRVARQSAVVPEVAPGDELAFGMGGEPGPAAPQQLVDLGIAHPVVLVVVEHGEQHEEVFEQRLQRHRGA